MRRAPVMVAALAGLLVAATGIVAYPATVSPEKAERLAARFVNERLTEPGGGILTSGKVRRMLLFPVFSTDDLLASGVLCETVGLAMRYAVLAEDRPLFDRQLEFAQRRLRGPHGLFYWKVSHDAELVAASSAVIDDLRIVGAALNAADLWDHAPYREFAEDIADRILTLEVVDGNLRDFLNWRDEGDPVPADQLRLSYIDTEVLADLARRYPDWQPVADTAGGILLGGRMPSGLFWEARRFDTGAYVGTRQNMINQLYSALFAAPLENGQHPFAEWLRDRFADDGVLYAQYDGETGEPTEFFESTSVYALAARYAFRVGENELGQTLLDKMLDFQNLNPLSPMYGGFSDDEVFSFDNLEALLTLRLYNATRAS